MNKKSLTIKKFSPILLGIILFLITSFLLGNFALSTSYTYPPDPSRQSIGFPIEFYHWGDQGTGYLFRNIVYDILIWIGISFGIVYLIRFFYGGIEKHRLYTKKD